MGTTESIFAEDASQASVTPDTSEHSESNNHHPQQRAANDLPAQQPTTTHAQPRHRPRRASTARARALPLLELQGAIVGLEGSGKRTLLQRLDGKDPFATTTEDVANEALVPYQPPGTTWDRIRLRVRTLERLVEQPETAVDFLVVLLHPQTKASKLKAYLQQLLQDLLTLQGYHNNPTATTARRPICLCLLLNFRDLDTQSTVPESELTSLTMEILQGSPHLDPQSLVLQLGKTSLKTCYGLDLLHRFIYESYLQRKRLDLEHVLSQVTHVQAETRRSPHVQESYNEFMARVHPSKARASASVNDVQQKVSKKEDIGQRHKVPNGEGARRPPPAKTPTQRNNHPPPTPKVALEAFLASDSEDDDDHKTKRVVSHVSSENDDDDFVVTGSERRSSDGDDDGEVETETGVTKPKPTSPVANQRTSKAPMPQQAKSTNDTAPKNQQSMTTTMKQNSSSELDTRTTDGETRKATPQQSPTDVATTKEESTKKAPTSTTTAKEESTKEAPTSTTGAEQESAKENARNEQSETGRTKPPSDRQNNRGTSPADAQHPPPSAATLREEQQEEPNSVEEEKKFDAPEPSPEPSKRETPDKADAGQNENKEQNNGPTATKTQTSSTTRDDSDEDEEFFIGGNNAKSFEVKEHKTPASTSPAEPAQTEPPSSPSAPLDTEKRTEAAVPAKPGLSAAALAAIAAAQQEAETMLNPTTTTPKMKKDKKAEKKKKSKEEKKKKKSKVKQSAEV